jgi:flagellar motor switch protein FliN
MTINIADIAHRLADVIRTETDGAADVARVPATANTARTFWVADVEGGHLYFGVTEEAIDALGGAADAALQMMVDASDMMVTPTPISEPPQTEMYIVSAGDENQPLFSLAFIGSEAVAQRVETITGFRRLHPVPVEVAVVLGKRRMTMREVLELGPGSTIELDRPAGAPVDLLVNDHLIARGEVVVLDDDFGLRITEIVEKDPTTL